MKPGPVVASLIALSVNVSANWCQGQVRTVTVSSIVENGRIIPRTRSVSLKTAEKRAQNLLVAGQSLSIGSYIESRANRIVVTLQCGERSSITLSSPFAVVVAYDASTACAIDLLQGVAVLSADQPTSLNIGGLRLGSEGTTYSVSATEVGRFSTIAVFEGAIRSSEHAKLETGHKITSTTAGIHRVDERDDIALIADILTTVDLAYCGNNRNSPSCLALPALETAALKSPENEKVQNALAFALREVGNDLRSRYHSYRATVLSPAPIVYKGQSYSDENSFRINGDNSLAFLQYLGEDVECITGRLTKIDGEIVVSGGGSLLQVTIAMLAPYSEYDATKGDLGIWGKEVQIRGEARSDHPSDPFYKIPRKARSMKAKFRVSIDKKTIEEGADWLLAISPAGNMSRLSGQITASASAFRPLTGRSCDRLRIIFDVGLIPK